MPHINIILYSKKNIFTQDEFNDIESEEIYIDIVNTKIDLHEALTIIQFDIVIINVDPDNKPNLNIVSFLRSTTKLGIVCISTCKSSALRIQCFENGADQFFSTPINIKELTFSIRNLYNRLTSTAITHHEPSPSKNINLWQLNKDSWCLISPNNHEVKLTSKEINFLALLMNQAGKNVSRHTLQTKLDYSDNDYGSRSIDSMVRRLRKKVLTAIGTNIPLQTVHSIGFCFSASAKIIDTSTNSLI